MRHSGEFPTRTKNNRTLRQTLLELQILQNNRTHPLVPQYYVFIDRKSTVYPVGSAPREFLTFSYHGGGKPYLLFKQDAKHVTHNTPFMGLSSYSFAGHRDVFTRLGGPAEKQGGPASCRVLPGMLWIVPSQGFLVCSSYL